MVINIHINICKIQNYSTFRVDLEIRVNLLSVYYFLTCMVALGFCIQLTHFGRNV